jgi:hypothetical protein
VVQQDEIKLISGMIYQHLSGQLYQSLKEKKNPSFLCIGLEIHRIYRSIFTKETFFILTSSAEIQFMQCPMGQFSHERQFAMQVFAGPNRFHAASFALRTVAKLVPWRITKHRIMYFSALDVIMKNVHCLWLLV